MCFDDIVIMHIVLQDMVVLVNYSYVCVTSIEISSDNGRDVCEMGPREMFRARTAMFQPLSLSLRIPWGAPGF